MNPPPIEFASLATGALGFTIALAWNDAVLHTIKSMFPTINSRGSAARAMILYALVVTVLVITIAICINKPSVQRFLQDGVPRAEGVTARNI